MAQYIAGKIKKKAFKLFYPAEDAETAAAIARAQWIASLGPQPATAWDALNSNVWGPLFGQWAVQQGIGDNVDFIVAVSNYENNNPHMLVPIVNMYIVANAPKEVNLGDANKVNFLVNAAANPPAPPNLHLFDVAKGEVLGMLEGRLGAFLAQYNL